MTTAFGLIVAAALAARAWGSVSQARQLRRIADALAVLALMRRK